MLPPLGGGRTPTRFARFISRRTKRPCSGLCWKVARSERRSKQMWSFRTQRTYTVGNGLPSPKPGKPLSYRTKYPRAVSSVGSERLVYTQEVTGSNPVPPTRRIKAFLPCSVSCHGPFSTVRLQRRAFLVIRKVGSHREGGIIFSALRDVRGSRHVRTRSTHCKIGRSVPSRFGDR